MIDVWYRQYYHRIDAQGAASSFPRMNTSSAASSIPRASLVACGGFDETMTAKEDFELGLRLWKLGLQFAYLPQARAYEFYLKPSRYVLREDGKAFGETESFAVPASIPNTARIRCWEFWGNFPGGNFFGAKYTPACPLIPWVC